MHRFGELVQGPLNPVIREEVVLVIAEVVSGGVGEELDW